MKETKELMKKFASAGFKQERQGKHIIMVAPNGSRVTVSQNVKCAKIVFNKSMRQAGLK